MSTTNLNSDETVGTNSLTDCEKNAARCRKYREANHEKVKEQKRKYREANREKVKEQNRKYYEANHEKVKEKKRKYRKANREKVKEQNRKYREANPEKVKEQNRKYYEANREKCRKYREANREKVRERKLAKKYRTTVEEIRELLSLGKCMICKSTERLCIDHCHTTGKIRGLLCANCNTALGMTKDNIHILSKLAAYLNSPKSDFRF